MADAERMERAAEDLRTLLREGHELLRDLRATVKEARPLAERLVEDVMQERLAAEVQRGLDEYATTIRDAMDKAVAKVGAEFERLAAIYLEGSKGRRRRGAAPLPGLAEASRRADEEVDRP